ncbi:STAS domain-containing protein [Rhodococcus sp. G-MC3]|uniref:STAS domain-containing protein n=1 Tax=Rhodococcus sp. G-MC3 TaxID=3046209 RepID=UPI0024B97A6E|nr:STAS domain-containing protein [Rhodococcus sp. G-MC3]MDJ0392539.1 STAS domain-containing protein [Rhodococcus sp. G-MC3]
MTVTSQNLNDEGTTRSQASRSQASETSVAVAATGAIFSSTPAGSDSLLVTVHGDIDMRSADTLSDYVCSRVQSGVRLVFDLSDVDFFGIAGLTVFTALDDAVEAAGSSWCLVEGHPVFRLLEAASAIPSVQRFRRVEDALA